MPNASRFPDSLLDQPAKLRLDYFKNHAIAHPLLKEAYETLRGAIREPAGSLLIFVFGPTGVGKTKLRQRIEEKIIEESRPTLEADLGRIPIISVEAVGPDSGNWNWKDYHKRVLIALAEPLIDHKINPDRWNKSHHSETQLHFRPREVAADLRHAVEQALRNRRPTAVLIDEAQHMAKMASGRKLQDQLDCIKSLANMTNIVHVLIGSYELLLFRNLSGQLSRRSFDVHFRRYRAENEKEIEAFQNIVRTFELHLPLKDESNLVQHWDYLFERSIGCVGVLKDWLLRTLAHVLQKQREAITLRDLEKWALTPSKCEKMLSEAIEGERSLEEKKTTRANLRTSLKLPPDPMTTDASKVNGNTGSQQQEPAPIRKRRVGEPNAKRYSTRVKSHVG